MHTLVLETRHFTGIAKVETMRCGDVLNCMFDELNGRRVFGDAGYSSLRITNFAEFLGNVAREVAVFAHVVILSCFAFGGCGHCSAYYPRFVRLLEGIRVKASQRRAFGGAAALIFCGFRKVPYFH